MNTSRYTIIEASVANYYTTIKTLIIKMILFWVVMNEQRILRLHLVKIFNQAKVLLYCTL